MNVDNQFYDRVMNWYFREGNIASALFPDLHRRVGKLLKREQEKGDTAEADWIELLREIKSGDKPVATKAVWLDERHVQVGDRVITLDFEPAKVLDALVHCPNGAATQPELALLTNFDAERIPKLITKLEKNLPAGSIKRPGRPGRGGGGYSTTIRPAKG